MPCPPVRERERVEALNPNTLLFGELETPEADVAKQDLQPPKALDHLL